MITPATANAIANGGNFVACAVLPRDVTMKIYHNADYTAAEKKSGMNKEADVAWRMMGIVGGAGAIGLSIAGRTAKGDDLKMINAAVCASSCAGAGIFLTNDFMKNDIKPEMRYLNLGVNLGLAAFAGHELIKSMQK